jgi:hypothetical protein
MSVRTPSLTTSSEICARAIEEVASATQTPAAKVVRFTISSPFLILTGATLCLTMMVAARRKKADGS